jgi:predicted RNA-binding Zn ribbon-like protein
MHVHSHRFQPADFVGGHVAIDLANTVTARNATPVDWLDRYPAVLDWAALTGHFDDGVLAKLKRVESEEPDAALLALQRLRELRETVHDVLEAAILDERAAEPLVDLEAQWKDAVAHTRVGFSEGHVGLELDAETSGLDFVRHELALRAFELLQAVPLSRTRICAGGACGWIFIDRSKGGRRRWCDMATCGNAAKSRRHYERTRASNVRSARS